MIIVRTPVVALVVVWAGRSRCHCFVAQDFLRFGVGMLMVSGAAWACVL